MPSCFNVTLGPFNDMIDILVGVLEVFASRLLVATKEGRRWCGTGLKRHRPATVLDTHRMMVFAGIRLGGSQVHI